MAADVMILFAHGARDPEWARPVQAVARRLRERFPDRIIEVAFLEFMSPTLSESVAQVVASESCPTDARIHILPFFIAQGGHLRKELPEMLEALRQAHHGRVFNLLPPLGELPAVQAAMAESISGLIP